MKRTTEISLRRKVFFFAMILIKIDIKQSVCTSFDGIFHVGRRLDVCPVFTMNVASLSYCMDVCLYYTDCLAVNFLHKQNYCEMLNMKKESMSPEKFNSSADYIYVDVTDWINLRQNNPCSIRPCPQGERCIPNKDTYLCQEADLCDTKYLVSGPCERVPDSGLTQSTYSYSFSAKHARLNSTPGWCAGLTNKLQYIQISFQSLKYIKQIVTLGDTNQNLRVKSFKLLFSTDCSTYRYYRADGTDVIFQGNRDTNTLVTNELQPPIKALCVRINPWSWYQQICMRVDLLGCSA